LLGGPRHTFGHRSVVGQLGGRCRERTGRGHDGGEDKQAGRCKTHDADSQAARDLTTSCPTLVASTAPLRALRGNSRGGVMRAARRLPPVA
jgi:hypothetical protein